MISCADLVHHYVPRGTARLVFEHRDPELLISGPAGTGKSRACLEKLHMMALLNPGMRGLIVRKTLASLGSTALVTWREHVIPEALATGVVIFHGGSQEKAPAYRYANGSTITVGGLDRFTRIMSSEYDVVYVQEAVELDEADWEAITTRLRNGNMSFQQLLADCNPDSATHWLKVRCDRGSTLMLNATHTDNPVLYDEHTTPDGTTEYRLTPRGAEYMGLLDKLTGVRYLRLRQGLWVAAEGVIYDSWNPAHNLVNRFTPPPDWARYWAVDFGFTNPFVCQMWAEDPDGRAFLYREIYHTQRTPDEHAARILDLVTDRAGAWREPRPTAIICDHDAAGRAAFERVIGQPTVAANKTIAVKDGIDAVKARIAPAGDGRPRLHICRDALAELDQDLAARRQPTSTLDELSGYVWNPTKDEPVKERDHGMDAMRYYVTHRDLRGEFKIRWL